MSKKQPFSDRLRELIDQSDLSRYEICKRAGLSQSVMSRFMHYQSGLSIPTIDMLCQVLDLELVSRKKGGK